MGFWGFRLNRESASQQHFVSEKQCRNPQTLLQSQFECTFVRRISRLELQTVDTIESNNVGGFEQAATGAQ
jgi:hypothetical protein